MPEFGFFLLDLEQLPARLLFAAGRCLQKCPSWLRFLGIFTATDVDLPGYPVKGVTLRFALFFCAACIGSLVGCGQHDEITVYSISVSDGPGDVELTTGGPRPGAVRSSIPSRMLAAIVPQGHRTWFFKMTGPDEEVAQQLESFSALVKSVRFVGDAAQPTWELPAHWRQQAASGMRFATIQMETGQRTLELTVIPLETMGDLDEYVLGNVNRWRGQLGLAPIAAIQPDDDRDPTGSLRQIKLDDATVVTLVNLVGQSAASDGAAPVFEMANHPPLDAMQTGPLMEPPGNATPFSCTAPSEWTATEAGGIRRAAFVVGEGPQKAEITVVNLPQSGGARLANVNRWRKQIELSDITSDQLAGDLVEIPLADTRGDYIELFGPADSVPRQAILATLVDVAGNTWFFKLKGPAELAERERDRFRAFVQSAKFSPEVEVAADE
jgi:hypothetical protein